MKKLFLIIVFLLLQSFPTMASPNGKGLICKCIDCSKTRSYHEDKEIGFLFEKNKVIKYDFITLNSNKTEWRVFFVDKLVQFNLNYLSFKWGEYHRLNRTNLKLNVYKDYLREKVLKSYQCKIIENQKKFYSELDLLEKKFNKINKKILKNRKF